MDQENAALPHVWIHLELSNAEIKALAEAVYQKLDSQKARNEISH